MIDRDIEDLVVRFPAGPTLQGIVRGAGGGALDPAAVHIWLRPKDPGIPFASATADASGEFTLSDIPAGVYEIGAQTMPQCGYLHSIRYDHRDVPNERLEIQPEVAGGTLEILIGLDGGEIRAVLQSSDGKALPSRNVHLLNDPPRFERPLIARTDQDGRVWFRHVRPGDYWLFAVDAALPGVPLSDRWEQHDGVSYKVTVIPNGVEEVVLRLPY